MTYINILNLGPAQRAAAVVSKVLEQALNVKVMAASHGIPPRPICIALADCTERVRKHGALKPTEKSPHQNQGSDRVIQIPSVQRPRTTAGLNQPQRLSDESVQVRQREARVIPDKHKPLCKDSRHFRHVNAPVGHFAHQRVSEQPTGIALERLDGGGHCAWCLLKQHGFILGSRHFDFFHETYKKIFK